MLIIDISKNDHAFNAVDLRLRTYEDQEPPLTIAPSIHWSHKGTRRASPIHTLDRISDLPAQIARPSVVIKIAVSTFDRSL